MARRLVRSFLLASALASLAIAGPCKVSSSTSLSSTTTPTETPTSHSSTTPLSETTTPSTPTPTSSTTTPSATTPGTTPSGTTPSASTTPATTPTTPVNTPSATPTTTPSNTPTPVDYCSYFTPLPKPDPICGPEIPILDPFDNGGFEYGCLAPWIDDSDDGVQALIKRPGYDGESLYRMETNAWARDISVTPSYSEVFEIYQTVKSCPGALISCTYNFKWDKVVTYTRPNPYTGKEETFINYVRTYQDDAPEDEYLSNRFPQDNTDAGYWQAWAFEFTVPPSGETTIFFVAESPGDPRVFGYNHLAIDDIKCTGAYPTPTFT